MKEIQKDQVLFEKTDEDSVTAATSSTTLSQAIAHNVTILNEKVSQVEFENSKLKDEIIIMKEEMNKQRKVEYDMTPLKENILEQQEHLHDVKMECFTEIQKMEDKVKVLEKHLEIVSQININMESLQVKIEEPRKECSKYPSSDQNL